MDIASLSYVIVGWVLLSIPVSLAAGAVIAAGSASDRRGPVLNDRYRRAA